MMCGKPSSPSSHFKQFLGNTEAESPNASSKDEAKKSDSSNADALERNSSNASWELLPINVWETILSLLPLSDILRVKSVSKTLNSIINSPSYMAAYGAIPHHDFYFILFANFDLRNMAVAFNFAECSWVKIPLAQRYSLHMFHRILAANGGLVLAEGWKKELVVSNLFTGSCRILPPMICAPALQPYVLALIDLKTSFKIISVNTADRVFSEMYDSATNSWEVTGICQGRYAMLGNAVCLDSVLFCLSHGPDRLLCYRLSSGTWGIVDVTMPNLNCSHILEHNGGLMLVGGIEEMGTMKRIGIWALDLLERQWNAVCFMPDHLFAELGNGHLGHFNVADGHGMICFCRSGSSCVLMYNLLEDNWWWLPTCQISSSLNNLAWVGYAVDARFDLRLE